MCWGRHTCHMGAVKALKALAAIPPDRRSPEVERTIAEGPEFVLRHRVHKRSHDPAKVSKPGWLRFGFPLMCQTDVLEILGILSATAALEFRREGAVRADGRSPLTGRTTGRRTRPAIPGAEP